MVILITYDVDTTEREGQKRLRQVAKACTDYGQRVQNSVFECEVTDVQLVVLKDRLKSIINMKIEELEKIVYYVNEQIRMCVPIEDAENMDAVKEGFFCVNEFIDNGVVKTEE